MVRWKCDIQFGFPFGELREGPLFFLTYRYSYGTVSLIGIASQLWGRLDAVEGNKEKVREL